MNDVKQLKAFGFKIKEVAAMPTDTVIITGNEWIANKDFPRPGPDGEIKFLYIPESKLTIAEQWKALADDAKENKRQFFLLAADLSLLRESLNPNL